jgi:hypothetical protein
MLAEKNFDSIIKELSVMRHGLHHSLVQLLGIDRFLLQTPVAAPVQNTNFQKFRLEFAILRIPPCSRIRYIEEDVR